MKYHVLRMWMIIFGAQSKEVYFLIGNRVLH